MSVLPKALYLARQVRELDRRAIEDHGIPAIELMQRAGEAAFELLLQRWPKARRIAVFCGGGNNGGDGYVAARLAAARGFKVQVWQVGDTARIAGTAAEARDAFLAAGGAESAWQEDAAVDAEVLVDALMGTGLSRQLEGRWAEVVQAINKTGMPVLALDIPTGLHSDTGAVMGCAVQANATVTFIGLKQGLLTGYGPDHTGELAFAGLDVPAACYENLAPAAQRISRDNLSDWLPHRAPASHKGRYGHVLVVGGAPGMGGAVRLAAEGALRSGAGLVTIATSSLYAGTMHAGLPEAMCVGVNKGEALAPLLERASVVALGPGLGQEQWSRDLFTQVLQTKLPLIVDADALNLLAAQPVSRNNWVLTPHPGEAARLLDTSVAAIQQDRFAAARLLAQRYQATAVLKGAGSLIADKDGAVQLCSDGNPGMATAGMGDVLTGIIAAFAAQGLPLERAAAAGVVAHAAAGDLAARDGMRGLLARDLLASLRTIVNPRNPA